MTSFSLAERKTCSKCGEKKTESEFSKDRSRKDGLEIACKACKRARNKAWREAHPEERKANHKAYREAHLEEEKARAKAYYEAHSEEEKARNKAYYKAHPEKCNASSKAYREAHQEKCNASSKTWREEHPEEHRTHNKAWREAHLEELRTRNRAWREAHLEELKAHHRAHYRMYPEQYKAYCRTRRARKLAAPGYFCAQEWHDLKAQYNYTCLCCGHKEPEINLSVDHVVPLSRGGSNWIENIQPLCLSCNCSKGTKTIDYRPVEAMSQPIQYSLFDSIKE
jgi:5-methylcytosine-specific restriction endonuclease McrA